MRRVVIRVVILLALVALALPMASLADTIGFKFDTCPSNINCTLTGTGGVPSFAPTYTVTGGGVTFTLNLTGIDCTSQPCSFTGGSVEVTNATGAVLMMDSLTGMGRVIRTITGNEVSDIFNGIELTPNPTGGIGTVAFGTLNGTVDWSLVNGAVSGFRVTSSGAINVPEPGTLGLLGTGLIGLAGMAVRKLKLGT